MSTEQTTSTRTASPEAPPAQPPPQVSHAGPAPRPAPRLRQRRSRAGAAMLARSEPMLWLTGGSLAVSIFMIVGLLWLVLVKGAGTFWPLAIVQVELRDGSVHMGEVTRSEWYQPSFQQLMPYASQEALDAMTKLADQRGDDNPPRQEELREILLANDPAGIFEEIKSNEGWAQRRLLRTGNFRLTGHHFKWIEDFAIKPGTETKPEWAVLLERLEWGRFYGVPQAFLVDGEAVATDPEAIWAKYHERHGEVRARWHERLSLEEHDTGAVNRKWDEARLDVRRAELDYGRNSPEHQSAQARFAEIDLWATEKNAEIRAEINKLNEQNARYQMRFQTAGGQAADIGLADIVRAYPANQLSTGEKWSVYGSRWIEFLLDDPREANTEGGVFPAIWGTVAMTLIMSIAVVPFGVLAALYLREYAKAGLIVSAVRIAINNLAGVPSIVFGVFGLGFFCYIIGAGIDELLFSAKLPNPTYGKGGLVWASLTLALLTLPVVIVATEEALAAVPSSMREGSYACGAGKWQTIYRIVLPRAMPGIMTGTILAMARGAGEVAPLMLVGAVKEASSLPLDGVAPYIHLHRSFMHLGFHIYDLGFQSQNAEAATPMVYTTTLLLILIIAMLNVSAVWLRSRLRRKFLAAAF